jgi:tetratricopeptide (TPR) repeat protein
MRKIVSDLMSKELRKIFKQEWNLRYQATFGGWDDTSVSGNQLFHLEKKPRSGLNNNVYLAKFRHGDTNQWDCTVLFAAILYSNSIGWASLNPTIQSEVNNLREIRNKIMHITEGKLSNCDFQTMTTRVQNAFNTLGLAVNEIKRIITEKNRYTSFQVLPVKPSHEVVDRSEKIKVSQDLQKLSNDNDGKLTYFYICGNPGSGKSQLARQVCEDIDKGINSQTETTFFMTLDGKSVDSLLTSYEKLCRRLNCDESVLEDILNSSKPKDEKIKDLISQITTRIKNWKRWWIIVDNVENLQSIAPLLPQRGDKVWNNGQIILTTQNKTSVPPDSVFTKHISISSGMNDQECRQLLALISRTDANDPLLDEVAENLDRQPLAMAAAAVYMRQVIDSNCPDFSWKDYLQKLVEGKRTRTEELLDQTNSAAYSSTMSRAVYLAVKKCAESDFILKHTFNFFSLISFESLPLDLIVQYIQQQDNDLDVEDISLAIKHCSLFLPVENKENDIRLHRVVHDAIKSVFPSSVESPFYHVVKTLYYFKEREDQIKLIPHLKAFHTGIKNIFPEHDALYSISTNFEKTEISDIYLFFGRILRYYCDFELSKEFQNSNVQIWNCSKDEIRVSDIYAELGLLHKELGEVTEAKHFQDLALEIRKEKLGQHHIKVADSYRNLGRVCYVSRELKKAEDYYEQALEIQKEQLDANHVDIAETYNKLGELFFLTNDLAKAKDYYERALEIQKLQLDRNHVDISKTYNNLGKVYCEKDDLEKAMNYFQQSLKIGKKQLGSHHIEVAVSYGNLGRVFEVKGDLEEALDHYERELEIKEEKLGPNHYKVANSCDNLGGVYASKGDINEAIEYYERALKIRKEQLGANHVDVAVSYFHLGNVYYKKDDLEKAKNYYERALEIEKEQLGANHVDVAVSYFRLGNVYYKKYDLEKAKDYYERALEIEKEQLGANHVDVAVSYFRLGNVYYKKGDLEKAKDYYERALEIEKEQLGANHVDVAVSYFRLGNVYYKKDDLEKAKDYYERALGIRKQQLGANHVRVAACYKRLGDVYYKKDDLEKAKDYYELGLEIRKEQLDPNDVHHANAYVCLGNVYYNKDDMEKAKDYYEGALEIRKEIFGPSHVDVAKSFIDLGDVYYWKGDREKAKDYYERALEIQKEQLGPNHVDVAESYNKLAKVYQYR